MTRDHDLALAQTRGWVRDVVRSGLLDEAQRYAEVRAAVAQDHPDLPADATARAWIAEAVAEWRAEAATWPEPTDHDRLCRAFARLEATGIPVLQGVADHWVAKARLEAVDGTGPGAVRGVAWFTPSDVWHAIDEAMLEVNLWHPSSANAAPGDPMLDEVVAVFDANGLPAHFDEGRIEVTARWQRRPPPPPG